VAAPLLVFGPRVVASLVSQRGVFVVLVPVERLVEQRSRLGVCLFSSEFPGFHVGHEICPRSVFAALIYYTEHNLFRSEVLRLGRDGRAAFSTVAPPVLSPNMSRLGKLLWELLCTFRGTDSRAVGAKDWRA